MSETKIDEEFLDTYEGEVLFLSQDLEELIEELSQDNISQDTLTLLQQKLEDVSAVFLSSSYTQHVSPMFSDFAIFVSTLDLENIKAFTDSKTYLKEIVSDINTYINFYFVERNFSDVYLFQDSLKNSITFLQNSYSCSLGECGDEDDGSELDFF